MTDLTPVALLSPVVQLETTDRALGGTGNPMNRQAQALLNRDAFRAQQIADNAAAVVALAGDLSNNADPAKGTAIVGRSGQVVSSIAALRTLLKTSPSKNAFAAGYYASGDGGGGQYRLDEADVVSADNGGTIIVATDGGRWKLTQVGKVTFRQFGAKGDGVDDTAALLAGVAGGARHFDEGGDFVTTAALPFPSNTVWTAGAGAKLRLKAGSDASLIVNSDVGGGNTNIQIFDLELDGDRANQGVISRPVALFKNCTNVKLTRVKAHDARIAVYTVDTYNQVLFVDCINCEVDHCEIYNSDQGGLGFYGTGGFHRLLFNDIHDCAAGIEGTYQTDSHLFGNKVRNTVVSLISWSGLRNIIYKNNVAVSTAAAGIVCGHSGTPNQIADQSYVTENIIENVFSYGVTVFVSAGVTVEGNKIKRTTGNSTHSIYINTGCADISVINNRIVDYFTSTAGACGIFVDGCPDATLRGNKVYGATGGGTGAGIRLFNACPDAEISGGIVADSAGIGLNLSATSPDCTVSGLRVRNSGGVGIQAAGIGVAVATCVVRDSGGAQGILISGGQGSATGNRVSGVGGGTGTGIHVNAVDYNAVVGNVLETCATGVNLPSGTDFTVAAANTFTADVTTKVNIGTTTGSKVAHNIGVATHDI